MMFRNTRRRAHSDTVEVAKNPNNHDLQVIAEENPVVDMDIDRRMPTSPNDVEMRSPASSTQSSRKSSISELMSDADVQVRKKQSCSI